MNRTRWAAGAGWAAVFAVALAPWAVGLPPEHKANKPPEDPNCAACRRTGPPADRHAQSGYGLCVAPWARHTYDCNYINYYVGGSARPRTWDARLRPEPRYPWEGVWGTDYSPALTASELWWTHGRLHQDGVGQYESDRRNVPLFLKFGR